MHHLLPTKRNLLLAKRNLQLATSGHDLLEKKFKVLLREYSEHNTKIHKLKIYTTDTLENAIIILQKAKNSHLDRIITKIPLDASIQISFYAIMGISLPKFHTANAMQQPYSLAESSTIIDEAFFAWQNVKISLLELAITKIALNRLNEGMKKAQKRSSALNNITIPHYQKITKQISNRLEENERDELARIKCRPKSKRIYVSAQT